MDLLDVLDEYDVWLVVLQGYCLWIDMISIMYIYHIWRPNLPKIPCMTSDSQQS
jgi:hypothetical protein